MVVGPSLAPDGICSRFGFGSGSLELVGYFIEGAAYNEVRIEKTLASGAQLIDLDGREVAAPGKVSEDRFAHILGGLDHFLVLLGRFFS
jgi:hypothetical protein